MAQTGYTPLLIYSSTTAAAAPVAGNLTNSTLGSELAINITDGKLFYKDDTNTVQVIAWKTTPTTAGGTGLTSYTAGDLLYYASGTALSKLAIGATGRWLGSSGTAPQWNAPAALTKTDDTNVTLTLGGSASTALLNAASLTLGWTGQLAVTRGGTGLATVAQGDILYGSAANTLSALAKNTSATRYLSNTGTSNNPAWAQIDLSNGVTGTLPTGNGGTGLASFTANSVLYASSTSALATSSSLGFDGTSFLVGTSTVISSNRCVISNTNDAQLVLNASNSGNGVYTTLSLANQGVIKVQQYWLSTDTNFYVRNNGGGVYLSNAGTSWTAVSDERYKDIIEPIESAVQKIANWRTVIGKYKTDEDGVRRSFLIAQDVHKTFPEAVDANTESQFGLRYQDLIPVLIKAIQEQQSMIDLLKSKMIALESK